MYARLLESDVEPSYADRPFDPKAAAADPFGVGSVTPQEVQTALHAAIQSRLDDHPTERANIVYAGVVPGVFAYQEGETHQVRDIRKRYVVNLKEPHVQPGRVYRVHLAPKDLAAAGWTRDYPEPKPTPPPPLRTATQTRLRASLAVRAV